MPSLVIMTPPRSDSGWYLNHFDTAEYWDSSRTYSPSTVFVFDCYLSDLALAAEFQAQGRKIIIDNRTETDFNIHTLEHNANTLWIVSGQEPSTNNIVRVPFWFGTQEQTNFARQRHYQPQPQHTHDFLLMQRRRTPDRDLLMQALAPVLHRAVYSDPVHKRFLPGEHSPPTAEQQRSIDPAWFDSTGASLVVEARQSAGDVFVTEKTVRSLVMCHPFVAFAQPSHLAVLRSWGFETFPELWDESYDSNPAISQRVAAIADALKQFDISAVAANTVQQKLQHNRAWLWDPKRTLAHDQRYIIDPIQEFINA